jgi:hypothetical protein
VFSHDGNGKITKITAEYTFDSKNNSTKPYSISFSALFVQVPTSLLNSLTFCEDSTQPRSVTTVSGNPGWIQGKPLFLGTLVSEDTASGKKAIDNIQVFKVLGRNTDSECNKGALQPQFGVDTFSGCTIQLAYSQFNSKNCSSIHDQVSSLFGNFNFTHFPTWGNSKFSNVQDWGQVILPTSSEVRSEFFRL